MKHPSAPNVGDRLRLAGPRRTLYHVRAVVDHQEDGPEGPSYVVVLRTWASGRWHYLVETENAFAVGLYVPA